jgi:hypothetical protein
VREGGVGLSGQGMGVLSSVSWGGVSGWGGKRCYDKAKGVVGQGSRCQVGWQECHGSYKGVMGSKGVSGVLWEGRWCLNGWQKCHEKGAGIQEVVQKSGKGVVGGGGDVPEVDLGCHGRGSCQWQGCPGKIAKVSGVSGRC